jgi:hypothetical protein
MNYDPDADDCDDLLILEAIDDLTTENGLLTRTIKSLVDTIDQLRHEGRIDADVYGVLVTAGTKEVAG